MEQLEETVKRRISLPPGLPKPQPTKAAWQEPPHPVVADVQSPVLPGAVDIVIIGSGITGCAVASTLLAEEFEPDLRVTVLEARQTCSGATGRNGGHLVSDCASLVPRLVPDIGADGASKIAKFSQTNIARIRQLISELNNTDNSSVEMRDVVSSVVFEDPGMFSDAKEGLEMLLNVYPKESEKYSLLSVSEASEVQIINDVAKQTAGLTNRMMKRYKYRTDSAGAIQQRGAGALWPYRLITATFHNLLCKHQTRFTIETTTPAESVEYRNGENFPYYITTRRGVIRANKIIHCTNGFSGHLLPKLIGAIYPSRGTMSVQKPGPSFPNLGDKVSWTHFSTPSFDEKTGIFCTGLYYAQQNTKTGEIFIGGERQKVTNLLSSDDSIVGSEAAESLCAILPKIFRDVEPVGEQKVWSGILGFTSDGLPLVGRVPRELSNRDGDGEWIAAGFNGHGMDKCWLSGEAVARMALGKDAPEFPDAFLLTRERRDRLGVDQSVEAFMSMLAA